jgi:signal transduction histidine kinase
MRGSIRQRLIALHLVAVTLAAIVLTGTLYWRVMMTADQLHEQSLKEQAEQVAGFLHVKDGLPQLKLPKRLFDLYGNVYARYRLWVLDGTGHVVFASAPGTDPLVAGDPFADGASFFQATRDKRHFFGVNLPVVVEAHPAVVELAEDSAHRDALLDDIVADFLPEAVWVVVPILLLLLAADLIIFERALRPLVRASALAREIGPERTDLRLPESDLPQEVRPLVEAVNAGLDRLARGLEVQRGFVADAAHEMRTPLAILRAQAEALTNPAAACHLVADIDAMTRVIGQMLDMADSEALTLAPGETADLTDVAAEVIAFLAPMALEEGKELALVGEPEPVLVPGNATALFRALRNLVENAIRHTPRGSTVEVDVGRHGRVSVRDHGPGVPETQRALIFQRFWRGNRRQAGHSGLGLAIAARIARMHGGWISVGTAPGGGAEFALHVPRA